MSRTEMILAPNPVTNADAIYYKDATDLAALIRTKQLSSREVVQAQQVAIHYRLNDLLCTHCGHEKKYIF